MLCESSQHLEGEHLRDVHEGDGAEPDGCRRHEDQHTGEGQPAGGRGSQASAPCGLAGIHLSVIMVTTRDYREQAETLPLLPQL